MPTQQKRKIKVVTPRRYRERSFYVPIGGDEHFKVRKADLPSLLMEGVLPTKLVEAIGRFDEIRQSIAKDQFSDALKKFVEDETGADIREMLRRCAVAFVIEPRLTHSKRDAREHADTTMWVGGHSDIAGDPDVEQPGDLAMSDLFTLWRALMGEVGVFVMSDEDADDFRTSESRSDAAPVSDGAEIPSASVSVPAAANGGDSTSVDSENSQADVTAVG